MPLCHSGDSIDVRNDRFIRDKDNICLCKAELVMTPSYESPIKKALVHTSIFDQFTSHLAFLNIAVVLNSFQGCPFFGFGNPTVQDTQWTHDQERSMLISFCVSD